MKETLVILGAGGHARSLLELLDSCGISVAGIYDDSCLPGSKAEMIGSRPLLGPLAALPSDCSLALAFGDNLQREDIFLRYRDRLLKSNLVHRTAYCAKEALLGDANQVFANVFINAQVSIGDNNILNSGAIIEHEAVIGSHNHISVGSILCGRVVVGNHCMIGAGSVVIDKVSICNNVIIGANSTVISSIEQPGVYVGSPARRVK